MHNLNFVAVVAEFNPVTGGHRYLVKKAKEITGLPVLAILSGNFVQRGEPAVIGKFDRAKLALDIGADVVIELPTVFALSSAPDFAYGAIKWLSACKNIKYLIFGSECGDLKRLQKAADEVSLASNSTKIKSALKTGKSFATSVLDGLTAETQSVLKLPNNLLGVEYLKAIKSLDSHLVPITISRKGAHGQADTENFFSSSAVRELLINGNYDSDQIIFDAKLHKPFLSVNNFEKPIKCAFVKASRKDLAKINGASEGIENLLAKTLADPKSLTEILDNTACKRYGRAKLSRFAFCTLLDIKKTDLKLAKTITPYFHILAVKDKKLLAPLAGGRAKLITKKADTERLSVGAKKIFNIDVLATKLYAAVGGGTNPNADFETKL